MVGIHTVRVVSAIRPAVLKIVAMVIVSAIQLKMDMNSLTAGCRFRGLLIFCQK